MEKSCPQYLRYERYRSPSGFYILRTLSSDFLQIIDRQSNQDSGLFRLKYESSSFLSPLSSPIDESSLPYIRPEKFTESPPRLVVCIMLLSCALLLSYCRGSLLACSIFERSILPKLFSLLSSRSCMLV